MVLLVPDLLTMSDIQEHYNWQNRNRVHKIVYPYLSEVFACQRCRSNLNPPMGHLQHTEKSVHTNTNRETTQLGNLEVNKQTESNQKVDKSHENFKSKGRGLQYYRTTPHFSPGGFKDYGREFASFVVKQIARDQNSSEEPVSHSREENVEM